MAEIMTPANQEANGPSLQYCVTESFKIRMESAKDGGRNLMKQQNYIE